MFDKIFALSSGHGKSGVAVIRISGDDLYNDFIKIVGKTEPVPRHAYFCNLLDDDNESIDQCLAIYFRSPNSFTGTDIIEIHSHGAPAVITKIFNMLTGRGARMAQPGEFSKRAFYNNKMDLTEIDGLAALLDAQTDMQRKQALKSLSGYDSKKYESWRSQMIEIAAYSAAILDYPSDELPQNIGQKIIDKTKILYDEINSVINKSKEICAIRNGFNIVLTGQTNVGKSSIFNQLLGANRAIVSDVHGTTRDIVSSQLDIDGFYVNLCDTAGIRESTDAIEKIGIEKTINAIKDANLILRVYADVNNDIESARENEIIVFNKSDLTSKKSKIKNSVSVSAMTGFGMDKLIDLIKEKINEKMVGTENTIVINSRTHGLLSDAANYLKSALDIKNHDIFAENVRAAADNIGQILGAIDTSEIANATFSQLCLGK